MSLPAANEATSGPGGMLVVDSNGLQVGRVLPPEVSDPPSEDVARVSIRLTDEAIAKLGLTVREADVEAAWLGPAEDGEFLRLDRPLDVALREQGFDL